VSGDPVSWLLIEPGWEVLDAQGEKIGNVKEVEGDLQADIFHGLRVERGLLGDDLQVPAENVREIHEGHLHLA
jgi:sporulation protein YlmC with PRC-barrel domain